MAIDSEFYKKKKEKSLFYALGFFVFTLLLSGGIFFYNRHLEAQNLDLKSQIEQRTAAVENLKQDKNIEAYYLYNLNQEVLTQFGEKSQISNFIKHAFVIMNTYDLVFEGFEYIDGVISINALAESNEKNIAYLKVVKLLQEYNVNQRSLFELQSVETFSGQDNIKFSLKFNVK